jgi:hypothetical protein
MQLRLVIIVWRWTHNDVRAERRPGPTRFENLIYMGFVGGIGVSPITKQTIHFRLSLCPGVDV